MVPTETQASKVNISQKVTPSVGYTLNPLVSQKSTPAQKCGAIFSTAEGLLDGISL